MILLCALTILGIRTLYLIAEVYFEQDWPRSTWRGFAVAFGLFIMCASAFGQVVRVDIPLLTSGPSIPNPTNSYPQALWVPNATVQICQHPATTSSCSYVTTYTDSTGSVPCPSTQQLVALPGTTCSSNAGILGNVGFWYSGGTVDYLILSAGGTYGPYTVTGINGSGNFVSTVTTGPQTMLGALNTPAINTVLNAALYPSVTAAIAALPTNGGVVFLPCGTYSDNLIITTSNVTLLGAGPNCTFLQPLTNSSVVTIDATGGNIQYVQMRDMTLTNTSNFAQSDGIQIKGPVNGINDWHYFSNLNIQGFRYGVNLVGRTIWTTFDNIHVGGSMLNGINANTSAVLNHIEFRGGQVNNSQAYGVYINDTNANAALSWEFDHVNVEDNGISATQANCAGMYLTGIGTMSIHDGYFEANCLTVPDALGADIRITGTFGQAIDVKSSLIWSATNYGILNDAIQTTGEYGGNKITNQTIAAVKIQTTHSLSNIHIGPNLLAGAVTLVPDGSNNTHTTLDGNYAIAQTWYGNLTLPDLAATGTLTGFTINATNFLQFNGSTILPNTTTGYHGTSGTKVQMNDGTGSTGNFATYASDGSVTNGPAASTIPTVGTASLNQAVCFVTVGPPAVIGHCTSVVGSGGACTCAP